MGRGQMMETAISFFISLKYNITLLFGVSVPQPIQNSAGQACNRGMVMAVPDRLCQVARRADARPGTLVVTKMN